MKKLFLAFMTLSLFSLASCQENQMEWKNPVITITINGYDPMVLELYYDVAPNTVTNFVHLAQDHYFDGSIFHRVIENFMIQGGAGDGSACAIAGEFTSNGFENNLLHERGVISMARTNDPNSATSQFFIMHKTSPHLDGSYAAFGKLVSGYETLDAIATTETNYYDRPLQNIVIESLTVETYGMEYPDTVCY